MDRPEEFRYDLGYGTVQAVHPKSWEVDILAEDGGLVQRAIVLTARLPEPSTPERPQWVVFGFASHLQGRPLCWPIPSRLTGPRLPRDELVWYDEVGPYRLSINTADEFEIRNTDGEALHRIRIQQQDGVVRLDTPRTRIVLREADQSVTIECDKALNVSCETATVHAQQSVDVTAGTSATVEAPTIDVKGGTAVTVEAPIIDLKGGAAINLTAPAIALTGQVDVT